MSTYRDTSQTIPARRVNTNTDTITNTNANTNTNPDTNADANGDNLGYTASSLTSKNNRRDWQPSVTITNNNQPFDGSILNRTNNVHVVNTDSANQTKQITPIIQAERLPPNPHNNTTPENQNQGDSDSLVNSISDTNSSSSGYESTRSQNVSRSSSFHSAQSQYIQNPPSLASLSRRTSLHSDVDVSTTQTGRLSSRRQSTEANVDNDNANAQFSSASVAADANAPGAPGAPSLAFAKTGPSTAATSVAVNNVGDPAAHSLNRTDSSSSGYESTRSQADPSLNRTDSSSSGYESTRSQANPDPNYERSSSSSSTILHSAVQDATSSHGNAAPISVGDPSATAAPISVGDPSATASISVGDPTAAVPVPLPGAPGPGTATVAATVAHTSGPPASNKSPYSYNVGDKLYRIFIKENTNDDFSKCENNQIKIRFENDTLFINNNNTITDYKNDSISWPKRTRNVGNTSILPKNATIVLGPIELNEFKEFNIKFTSTPLQQKTVKIGKEEVQIDDYALYSSTNKVIVLFTGELRVEDKKQLCLYFSQAENLVNDGAKVITTFKKVPVPAANSVTPAPTDVDASPNINETVKTLIDEYNRGKNEDKKIKIKENIQLQIREERAEQKPFKNYIIDEIKKKIKEKYTEPLTEDQEKWEAIFQNNTIYQNDGGGGNNDCLIISILTLYSDVFRKIEEEDRTIIASNFRREFLVENYDTIFGNEPGLTRDELRGKGDLSDKVTEKLAKYYKLGNLHYFKLPTNDEAFIILHEKEATTNGPIRMIINYGGGHFEPFMNVEETDTNMNFTYNDLQQSIYTLFIDNETYTCGFQEGNVIHHEKLNPPNKTSKIIRLLSSENTCTKLVVEEALANDIGLLVDPIKGNVLDRTKPKVFVPSKNEDVDLDTYTNTEPLYIIEAGYSSRKKDFVEIKKTDEADHKYINILQSEGLIGLYYKNTYTYKDNNYESKTIEPKRYKVVPASGASTVVTDNGVSASTVVTDNGVGTGTVVTDNGVGTGTVVTDNGAGTGTGRGGKNTIELKLKKKKPSKKSKIVVPKIQLVIF